MIRSFILLYMFFAVFTLKCCQLPESLWEQLPFELRQHILSYVALDKINNTQEIIDKLDNLSQNIRFKYLIEDPYFIKELSTKYIRHFPARAYIELIDAIKNNNLKAAKFLIVGKNYNNRNEEALLIATINANKVIVKLLIEEEANVNYKDQQGWTALIIAVSMKNKKIIDLLLKAGADVNCKSNHGNTPLMWATDNKEILQLLISHGADVNAQNNDKNAVLIWAVLNDNKQVVKKLLKANVNVNSINNYGNTILTCAREKDNKEIVQMLLDAGAK